MRIDTFNRSRGRRLSPAACELAQFTARIGVKAETHYSQTNHAATLLSAQSMS